MRATNLALKFLLELCAFAALGYTGSYLGTGALRVVAAIAFPLLATLVWGRWAAPASAHRLALPARAPSN